MLNKVQLIGNLGSDPDIQITSGGNAVATFSLATNRRWKDREGTKHEATDWHRIVCWGQRAEIASKYLEKGRLIYVEGRLQTSSWLDEEEGVTRYRTEVVCLNLQMLGKADSNVPAAGSPPEPPPAQSEEPDLPAGDAGDDDDIPF